MLECMLIFPKHHRSEFRNLHFPEKVLQLKRNFQIATSAKAPHAKIIITERFFLLLLVKSKDDRKVSLLKAKTEKESLHPPHGHHGLEACYILQWNDLQAEAFGFSEGNGKPIGSISHSLFN